MIRLGDDELELREVHEDDRAFVLSTWLRSYLEVATKQGIPAPVYFLEQERLIRRVWSLIQAACRSEAPTTIHGWVCGRPGVLHYVYVVKDFRRMGFARQMVEAVCGPKPDFTHRWPYKTPHGWTFNPYLVGVAA